MFFFFLIPDSLILFKIYDIAHQKKKKKRRYMILGLCVLICNDSRGQIINILYLFFFLGNIYIIKHLISMWLLKAFSVDVSRLAELRD